MESNHPKGQQELQVLLALSPEPLGLQLNVLSENRAFLVPLTVSQAQFLAIWLLEQPGVGGDLWPEALARYVETQTERRAKDGDFLKSVGVTYATNN